MKKYKVYWGMYTCKSTKPYPSGHSIIEAETELEAQKKMFSIFKLLNKTAYNTIYAIEKVEGIETNADRQGKEMAEKAQAR